MSLLADIPGNVIFLIVAAAVGVVNWWFERKKKKESEDVPPPRHRPLRPAGDSASPGDSEQERLRRFLEALGVPQQPPQSAPPPQSPPRPVRPPAPVPAPSQRPLQKPIEKAVRTPIPTRPATPPPLRTPARVRPPAQVRPPVRETDEIKTAGRLEEPALAIESTSSEFEHMTMEQLGVPAILAKADSLPATVLRNTAAPVVESLRLALRTPADLRTAFVLMELLGKPRGLQG